jgi:hypothetical protein
MRIALIVLISSLILLSALACPIQANGPFDREISGTVVDEQGAPFSGVNVTARNVTTGESFHSLTDEGGNYSISLPSGVYNVSASFTNHSTNITYSNMVISEADLTGLNFTMRELLGTITGYVTNGTAPVTGAAVHLSGELNYTSNSTIPLGAYTISGIRPGTYVAYAEKSGYWTNYHDLPVLIERGKTTRLNFTLEEQPATIYGRVKVGGDGIAGVMVTVTSGGTSFNAQTDTEGNYTLSGIPVGTYTITFSKTDLVSQDLQISLSPFESKRLDVTLEREVREGEGFIPGFDLPHSLMIVGLVLALITIIFSLLVRLRVERKPELLDKEEAETHEED